MNKRVFHLQTTHDFNAAEIQDNQVHQWLKYAMTQIAMKSSNANSQSIGKQVYIIVEIIED